MDSSSARLAQLLRDRKERLIERWSRSVRALATPARDLERPLLHDNMPELVDQLIEVAERGTNARLDDTREAAMTHANERLRLGYDIGALANEHIVLRAAIHDELDAELDELTARALRPVEDAIDFALREVIERFDKARALKLAALETISSEEIRAADVDQLLARLVEIILRAATDIDTVTILLREGDSLRVRATRGLEEELERGFALAIGHGFAGTVAATRRPLALRDAANDPLVVSEVVRRRGLRAMYGIPLLDGDDLVGVAHIGSRGAREFAEEDLLLFRGLAIRATGLIAARRQRDEMLKVESLREQFVAVLGHDLRSPLAAITGSAQILLHHARLGDAEQNVVLRISRSAARMSRLIDRLLDFTRARLGKGLLLEKSWHDLEEVVRHGVEEERIAHPGRSIEVHGAVTAPFCGDRDRIAQLVSNLISNALAYSPPTSPVTVTLRDDPAEVRVVVHNEGAPIPRALIPNIFEPFRRGEAGENASPRGLGLGLFIVHAVAVAHGGSVEAESGADEGTTFTVKLPRGE